MLKRTAFLLGSAMLLLAPVFAAADTIPVGTAQLIPLYTQLVQLLQQEITLLQNTHASLSTAPVFGPAPLTAIFAVNNPSGTEAIDFGDGHSSGSARCAKNQLGWCDLSRPIVHTYQLPGTYSVRLLDHPSANVVRFLSTTTVSVSAH